MIKVKIQPGTPEEVKDSIFREMELIQNDLRKFVCPIFSYMGTSNNMQVIGSSVLYKGGIDDHFLLTAAHVLAASSISPIFIPGESQAQLLTGTAIQSVLMGAEGDREDFALIKLDSGVEVGLSEYSFLEKDDLELSPKEDLLSFIYSIMGFPISANKSHSIVKRRHYALAESEIQEEEYVKNGFDRSQNTGIRFKKKVIQFDGTGNAFPDPYGISGGACWRWALNGDNKNGYEMEPKLNAIVIEKGEVNQNIVWSTKIAHIYDQMRSERCIVHPFQKP